MPRCIFCLRDDPELTDEHVFPAALGGKLTLKNATCTECASSFSKAFEQSIATSFVDFRFLLQIPDRYSKVPGVSAKAEVKGKVLDAKVLPDGTVQLKPNVTVVSREDGAKDILYEHGTARQKEKLRQEAKEKGDEFFEEPVSVIDATVSLSGKLDFIGSPEALRTAAKIAYTGLALKAGSEFAIRDLFDGVRHYVQTGEGEPNAKLFFNEGFINACVQGPHQHSIVIAGRRDRRRVDAIVRLFGELCYFVNLTERYEGADFSYWLGYNAQSGKEVEVLRSNVKAEFLQIEDVATSPATVWNDIVVAGERFIRFVNRAFQTRQQI